MTTSASRRVKALLAGGLVLGVGAAITLAAWNDSEFASAEFNAGDFDMLGSVDDVAFANHASGSPAALSFSSGFDDLSPDTTVAAPFVLHLSELTDYNASVAVQTAVGSGTAETHLTYGIQQVANFAACDEDAVGTTIVPAGTALDSVAGAATFPLTGTADLGVDPGDNAYLCIQVTTDSTLAQGTDAVGTWQFYATSINR